MNKHDKLEQRLRRQNLRPVPPAWRAEILVSAQASQRNVAAEGPSEDQAALFAGWRLLFARIPIAWASLAVLWAALIGVNLTMHGPFVSLDAPGSPSVSLGSLAALDFPQADSESPIDQSMPAPQAAPASDSPAVRRRPRSDRRHDSDADETHSKFLFGCTA